MRGFLFSVVALLSSLAHAQIEVPSSFLQRRAQDLTTAGLEVLARSRDVALDVRFDTKAKTYRFDAASVLSVRDTDLKRVSLDYDAYVAMGMPYVRQSATVFSPSEAPWLIWTQMQAGFFGSRHFLSVDPRAPVMPTADPRASGTTWILVHPKDPLVLKRYSDETWFSRLDGAFYIEPIDRGPAANPQTYIRYVLIVQVDSQKIPEKLVAFMDAFVRRQLGDGVRRVIRTLENHSRPDPSQ